MQTKRLFARKHLKQMYDLQDISEPYTDQHLEQLRIQQERPPYLNSYDHIPAEYREGLFRRKGMDQWHNPRWCLVYPRLTVRRLQQQDQFIQPAAIYEPGFQQPYIEYEKPRVVSVYKRGNTQINNPENPTRRYNQPPGEPNWDPNEVPVEEEDNWNNWG